MHLRIPAALACMTLMLLTGPARAQESSEPEGPAPGVVDSETVESKDSSLVSIDDAVPRRESLKPLWIAGLISWSAIYVAGIIATAAIAEDIVRAQAIGYMAIPLVGPFIFLGNDNDDILAEPAAPIVVSGVLQILCVGIITAGLLLERDVPDTPRSARHSRRSVRMRLAPVAFGRNGVGALFTLSHY